MNNASSAAQPSPTQIQTEPGLLGRAVQEWASSKTLSVAPVHLVDVVSEVIDFVDEERGRVHLVMERAPAVIADRALLAHAVTNLLRYALDRMPPNSAVEVEVAGRCLAAPVDTADDAVTGHLAHDCRPAVSVAMRDYDAGPRRHVTRARDDGLGLAVAHAIVELHRGRLWSRHHGATAGFCLMSAEEPA